MGSFNEFEITRPFLFGNSRSAVLGTTTAGTHVIQKQSRRLKTLKLHANVTIAGPTSTAGRDAIEGLLKEVRLMVSDKAGSTRTCRKASSATLLAWHRRNVGKIDARTQAAFGKKTAATYNLVIPLHISDTTLGEVAEVKTSIPMWGTDGANNGVGEDVRLELSLASLAEVGLSAGTVTINYLDVQEIYIEGADTVGYVPTELLSNDVDWGTSGGEQTWPFPEKGWLASFMVESFTSSTVRADALATVTSSVNAFWRLKYGRSDIKTFTTILAQAEDGWWMNEYPADESAVADVNDTGIFMRDLVRAPYSPQAFSAGALPNLYLANGGDRASLVGTNLQASSSSKVTTWKFLVNDLAVLSGV